MQSNRLGSPFRFILILVLSLSAFGSEARKTVRRIEIQSGWGGLGPSAFSDVIIRWKNGAFVRDGKPVGAARVQALVAALEAPRIAKPEMENLGATPAWLEAHVASQRPMVPGQILETTANQQKLFTASFTNPKLIARVIPELFSFTRWDDYPGVNVEVVFDDGSKLIAESDSYYVYMLPWSLKGQKGETYNTEISRAVSALMPRNTVCKERLAGNSFLLELVDVVMNSIETQWNLRGSENWAGDALRALRRSSYVVTTSEIGAWHQEYGTGTYKGEPEEMNLHATVRKPAFPRNVNEVLVLRYVEGKVEGVEEFLKTVGKYEELALSVAWLNEFIRKHPKVPIRISYVQHQSFGDKAIRTFADDMKLRGREDLVEQVRAQQSEITLLIIGTTHEESYWLLFPDKHMMLWRYDGPSGLLKWTRDDFQPGQCSAYQFQFNFWGVCSGIEITADGALVGTQAQR